MRVQKVCAIKGPAGKQEVAGLIEFAIKGWNIAFMDPFKEAGDKLKQNLKEKYGIKVNVLNEKENKENKEKKDGDGDIEGFFYHGNWDDEEDVDIFWGFLEGKYGSINHIISSKYC
ncbi:MAG: hypothetical protein FWG91_07870 [Lachnospiraceae bacterium]|nr:hypothetical protein [Lachnospiraceae bacterium]